MVAEGVVSDGYPPGRHRARRTEGLSTHRLDLVMGSRPCDGGCRARGNRRVETGCAEQSDGPTLGERTFEDADRRRPDHRGAPSGGAHRGEHGVGPDGIDDDECRAR